MRPTPSLAAALLALGLFACDQKPEAKAAPAAAARPETAIQHDQPSAPPSPKGEGDATALPPGHPPVGPEMDSKALLAKVEQMKAELKDRPKTLEVLVALGSLYYDNGRYLDAIDYYRQAIEKAQPAVDLLQALKKRAGSKKPVSLLEAGCDRSQIRDFDQVLAKALAYRDAGKLADALACAREATKPAVVAHGRRGNAFYLIGNAASALEEHERALALDPNYPESLFFSGAICFDSFGDDLPRLHLAEQRWRQLLKVAPDHPRAETVRDMMPKLEQAIALGGVSKLPQPEGTPEAQGNPHGGAAPALNQGEVEAVQNTEITPDLIKGFDEIMGEAVGQIAQGDAAGAGTNMKRVFPFVMSQPDKFQPAFRARASALMALYMASKGAPMAQMLIGQAVQADPASVDELADALKAKGDAAHARTLWNALQSSAPDYAQKQGIAAKVR